MKLALIHVSKPFIETRSDGSTVHHAAGLTEVEAGTVNTLRRRGVRARPATEDEVRAHRTAPPAVAAAPDTMATKPAKAKPQVEPAAAPDPIPDTTDHE